MPAKSIAQRQLMAIAEHNPEKLNEENKDLAKLPKKTLHEYSSTKGLKRKHVRNRGRSSSR